MDPLSVSDASGVPPATGAPAAVQVVAPPPATVTAVRNPLRLVRPPKVTGRLIRPQVVSVVSAGGRTQTRALPVVKIPVGAMSAVTSSMFVIKPRQPSPEQKQAEVVATQPVPVYETSATVLQTPESEEICQSTVIKEMVPHSLHQAHNQPAYQEQTLQTLHELQPPPSQVSDICVQPVSQEIQLQQQSSDAIQLQPLPVETKCRDPLGNVTQEPRIVQGSEVSYTLVTDKVLHGDESRNAAEHMPFDQIDTVPEVDENCESPVNDGDNTVAAVAKVEDDDEDDMPLAARKRKSASRGRGRKRPRSSSVSAASPPASPAAHPPPAFSCTDCNESFADRLALAAHERRHGDQTFTCSECQQTFTQSLALRRHKLRHGQPHRARAAGRRQTKTPSRYLDSVWAEVGIRRRGGGVRKEEMVTCGVCDKEMVPEEAANHLRPPASGEYFLCEQCGKTFGQKCQLSRHGCRLPGTGRMTGKGNKQKGSRVPADAVVPKVEEPDAESQHDADDYSDGDANEGADSVAAADDDGDADDPAAADATSATDTGDGQLTCDVCQINFVSQRNLNRHRAQHESGTRYSCEVCEQSYARLDDLTRHTRSVHNQKRQFRCPGCMRRFTQKRIVEYHMRTHESSRRRGRTVKKGNRLKKENGELEDIKDSPGPGPVKYTCEECGAGFDTRRRFIRHQQMRHDAEAPRYECEVCSATYTRIDELTRHSIQIHHQKKTVPCPRCTRLFTQQRIVDYHVRGHDTKRVYNRVPRPYRCETCQRSFSTEALLVRHNCRDKTSTQRCVCDICGRGVSCPQALRRHRLQHLEERPAKCDTCGAAFIDDVALSKHVLTHSDEKPFLCDHCGKGFRFKDYLVRHTRFHTGERPYPCSACDKRFATSDTLHRHFLIHTGEKPYVCELCGRPFRQAQQLKTHMKIHNRYSPSFTTQQGSSQRSRSFANAKPAASAPTQLRLTELTNASGAPEVPATGAALLVADEGGQLRLVEEGHADVTLQEIHTFETQVL
ncbi:zinc finger protein 184-like [Amphibalanus amphitrite]|uniref:zinc finger protein 184-like n=1 Tax=Amphibalanus amphitrite TaxID=1232801 RepID=UPI001C920694|nr:zinc finger protein 184-like [Amphibalanus amphitrite]XP_043228388.1 zinc finger protein 184-like [Amphibalanus amphitrite]